MELLMKIHELMVVEATQLKFYLNHPYTIKRLSRMYLDSYIKPAITPKDASSIHYLHFSLRPPAILSTSKLVKKGTLLESSSIPKIVSSSRTIIQKIWHFHLFKIGKRIGRTCLMRSKNSPRKKLQSQCCGSTATYHCRHVIELVQIYQERNVMIPSWYVAS